jgi:hypothetical protein
MSRFLQETGFGAHLSGRDMDRLYRMNPRKSRTSQRSWAA